MSLLRTAVVLGLGASLVLACNKAVDTPVQEAGSEFGFGVNSEVFSEHQTKAQEATSIVSFKAESTQGNAGSETNASPCWNNIVFTSDGQSTPTYKASPAKYWPRSNPNYNFYGVAARTGSNGAADAATAPSMTFGASGTTISLAAADNNKDVVCAYLPKGDVTYRTKNTLTFEHIYARVSTVKLTANALYDMTNITVKIKNVKTGGVYNLRTGCGQSDGTGWSSKLPADGTNPTIFTCSSISRGGNYTGANNDLYVVPGEYKLLATWTATNDDYTQTFTDKESDNIIHLVGGKVNNIIGDITGNGVEITFSVVLTPWGSNTESGVTFPVEDPPSFGGLYIAPGNLYYNGTNWSIDSSWNEHCTYNAAYGVNSETASTYFNFLEMGALFEKVGFSNSDGDIENLLNPLDGWRLLTQADFGTLTTGYKGLPRDGATVNGESGKKYALVKLKNGETTYAGNSNPGGVLLFPDGVDMTIKVNGSNIVYTNNGYFNSDMTLTELNDAISQGCAFLPACGQYILNDPLGKYWDQGGITGEYWSSTEYSSGSSTARNLLFFVSNSNPGDLGPSYSSDKTNSYYPVRLVRDAE